MGWFLQGMRIFKDWKLKLMPLLFCRSRIQRRKITLLVICYLIVGAYLSRGISVCRCLGE
ncbi:hypothetical protein RHMOL_Rhmol04G0344900 [Rhododendron molle]|uniref:Uncharacterized protein n=2 Tax=Rhododendron molle TaxID=49168 RepID=A0ACC0P7A4_RHOML|nr:hypothetical protein RHMOL_Rhmol04G0344900 [Rhododendron molle]